ncbi:myristoyl transferase [Desulfosarcina widdelii]|uniref:Thiamine pyrimidine synthase n=1 Tax=Desulfosarcina widdelii TaxID=947919 RepID=A0A5K7Z714_9BACT|nr:ABC transporter substrate-binding protein [Desulfosarcina widdelii]BBO75491.1 myristoyl transferase [Desulfosarcina widdelii]
MRASWRVYLFILLVSLWAVNSGCLTPRTAVAGEKVAYRLKWLINASTAGDVFAASQGFFAARGLDVDVKAGGPERDAIRELELNYAQFGVASADQVIRALAKGASVVVLAQLFQVNPLQWIYRTKDCTIKKTQDLAGRTVGITYGGNDETIMRALLASAGMTEGQVRLASVRYDYTPFLNGSVSIWPVYRNTQGIYLTDKLASAGEQVAFFDPSDHGVRFVANSVVTSQKMIDQHPDMAKRFVRALLAGWEAAMNPANETEVIQALAKSDPDTLPETMRRQLAVTRRMVQPDPTVPLGRIDKSAWQQTEQIMVAQKLVPDQVGVVERLVEP